MTDECIVEERKIENTMDFQAARRAQIDFWRSKFMELGDPTGYHFAEKWIEGGYRRWGSYSKGMFKKEISEWVDTLEAKLLAESIVNIAKNRQSFQAQAWLARRGWVEKVDNRTKENKKKAEKVAEEVASDMDRLGLRRVV